MEKKEHLKWWDENLPTKEREFSRWFDSSDVQSRKLLYDFTEEKKIEKVLECGPGTYLDYHLYFKNTDKKYDAIDITDKIVKDGKQNNIDVTLCSIESICKPDNSYDLVYCRHVLEHQDDFKKSIDEMVRVSDRYIILIFWILSDGMKNAINYNTKTKLYHNSYSKILIEKYIEQKNLKFYWKMCNNDKILIIEK